MRRAAAPRHRCRTAARGIVPVAIALAWPAHASPEPPPTPAPDKAETPTAEVVVQGTRGSAVTTIAPLATLDPAAIAATGASTLSELLSAIRSVTTSPDGSPPIFLLNGQRVSGYDEISSFPPEAIERVEVLPEEAALKFGYPPTRRVTNFITKRRFHTLELRTSAGKSSDGGAWTEFGHSGFTRLHDNSRLTLSLDYTHTDGLLLSQRHVLPDPEVPFDAVGNVLGLNGGVLDPALSAIAGRPVTQAPVPLDPASRSDLAAYAAGAGTLRPFDPGPLRSLTPNNDTIKGNAVVQLPITRHVAGSLNLSVERSLDRGRAGSSAAVFYLPASNPYSPFANDALLFRSLTEVGPLRQRQLKTTLHAGGVLRGSVRGWQWDVTTSWDDQLTHSLNDRAIDITAAQAAIDAGADPFAPIDPALLGTHITDRLRNRVETADAKAVVTGTPFLLPAGKATLTATGEGERATAHAVTRGPDPYAVSLARNRVEGGVALDLPIADARADVLPFLGQLSVNASAFARTVSGLGTLHDVTYGLTWTPIAPIQLVATDKHSQAAPDLAQRSAPITRADNASLFDYETGQTVIGSIVSGGNPDLVAERREVRSLELNVKPFAARELRLTATFQATRVRDAVTNVYAATALTSAILPDLFVRDAAGQLTTVIFRPINADRTWTKTLNVQLNSSGTVGPKPPPAKPGTPTVKPKDAAFYYGGIGAYLTLESRVRLRAGTPVLDIIGGETISGGGSPGTVLYTYAGLGYKGFGFRTDAQWVGGSRIRSDLAASDLRFEALPQVNVGIYIWGQAFAPKAKWAEKMRIGLDVDDATNSRQHVRDGMGRVPYRFQPELLTPVGRTVKLTLRKLL